MDNETIFTILKFMLVGFFAQMIDGALGMAYGVSSTTFLLSLGIPPAAASASVHMSEIFTTAVSGITHWKLRNIDTKLVKKLLLPGVAGGVLGAYMLVNIDGDLIKPFISAYLLIMGIIILIKAFGPKQERKEVQHVSLLGLVGGFFDAIGGGGWGPIVTTTLVARGNHPRATIGSVNFTEFFVTFAQSVTFILSLSFLGYWQIIVGLLLGGVIAAPMAAFATKRIPLKVLMILVGTVIILLSIRTIWLAVM
jgi:uncharacterized membrane protein YfcA